LFAYGSGCQGELYCGSIGSTARALVSAARLDDHLDQRRGVSVAQYEQNEHARTEGIDCPYWRPNRAGDPVFEEMYRGRELLVLDRVENYYRHYEWS
jgi:3-hydroxy-3-methylglutaryl CoA synthase